MVGPTILGPLHERPVSTGDSGYGHLACLHTGIRVHEQTEVDHDRMERETWVCNLGNEGVQEEN